VHHGHPLAIILLSDHIGLKRQWHAPSLAGNPD